MLKILRDTWYMNKATLRDNLKSINDIDDICYLDLVKMSFTCIYNIFADKECITCLDVDRITQIDDGGYQGTLLFLIPFDTYQPDMYEYLMTYVNYGSCSGCDTLQRIQAMGSDVYDESSPTNKQVDDLLTLCKDIICNTIKPYNRGWYYDDAFKEVEELQKEDI